VLNAHLEIGINEFFRVLQCIVFVKDVSVWAATAMDRAAFLSSLPFLIPLHSPAWPPMADGTILLGERYDSRIFLLSLEIPSEPDGDRSISASAVDSTSKQGLSLPLFFDVSKETLRPNHNSKVLDDADRAMATIQIAVVDNAKESHSKAASLVFFRVDEHVYALDLPQCKSVVVHPEAYNADMDDDEEATYRHRRISRPCSLVLEFDSATLRIFRNNLDGCAEDKERLSEVRSILTTIENGNVSSVPAAMLSKSPTRCSNEANSSSGSTTVDEVEPKPLSSPTAGCKHARADTDCCIASVQRRRSSFQDSLSNLANIRHVLDLPVSAVSNFQPSEEGKCVHSTNVSLKPILNCTLRLMSQSFVSASTFTAVDEHHSALQESNEQEMERLLGNFFPAPHRSGRRRTSNDGTNGTDPVPQNQQHSPVCTEAAVRLFQHLICEHTRIVKERHTLCLLPSRG
jgi:hypothetical protein